MTGSHQESGGRLLLVLVPKCARQTTFTDIRGEKVQGEEAVRKRKYVLCFLLGFVRRRGREEKYLRLSARAKNATLRGKQSGTSLVQDPRSSA